VADAFALCKFSIPFTVILLLAVIPPAPLIVKLLIAVENNPAGNVIAEEFANTNVEFPADISPEVLEREFPDNVKVFVPILNVPEVRVNEFVIFKSPF
jgi:hypothetical protein